jgi:hypothetical protein
MALGAAAAACSAAAAAAAAAAARLTLPRLGPTPRYSPLPTRCSRPTAWCPLSSSCACPTRWGRGEGVCIPVPSPPPAAIRPSLAAAQLRSELSWSCPARPPPSPQVLVYGDCAVNVSPSSQVRRGRGALHRDATARSGCFRPRLREWPAPHPPPPLGRRPTPHALHTPRTWPRSRRPAPTPRPRLASSRASRCCPTPHWAAAQGPTCRRCGGQGAARVGPSALSPRPASRRCGRGQRAHWRASRLYPGLI